jgi:hypothetical protein
MVEPPARWVRAGLAVVGLAVASLVVAIGSTGLREGDRTDPFLAVEAGRLADLVLVLVAAGAIVATLLALTRRRRRTGRREVPPPAKPWHVLAALGLLAILLVTLADLRPVGEDTPPVTATLVRQDAELIDTPPPAEGSPPGWGLWLAATAGVAALLVLVAGRRRRRPAARPSEPFPSAPVAVGTAPETADEPRRRIFAAYRQVEEAAAASGLHRPPARTVRGHLGVLGSLSSAGAADRLSRSYDAARYAPDEPAAAMVDEAEQASRHITDGLT